MSPSPLPAPTINRQLPTMSQSSRNRYAVYLRDLKQRRKTGEIAPAPPMGSGGGGGGGGGGRWGRSTKRSRSFLPLFQQFWALLEGSHRTILGALGFLTVATLLGLLPLYGSKLVIDNVLNAHPLPPGILAWGFPQSPRTLLTFVAVGMVLLAAVAEMFSLTSRWWTTRVTKRVQVSVRRRVFDHAVKLPLHRVYELKSGGVASILREDAGGVAELIFSMLHNPWRAIIQLTGSLIILATVDWRMLLGSIILFPTVWFTHRTWIGRIRPIFRDIRSTRQSIDARAAESFGGMRVVRSFSRQRAETAAFTRNNHLMARQEIYAWWWSRGVDTAWAVLIPFATAMLMYFGGRMVLHDSELIQQGLLTQANAFTAGDLVMFLTYLASLLAPIATLASSATGLQNNLAGLDRVLDLLAEPIEMPDRPGAKIVEKSTVEGRITFENVAFSYAVAAKKPQPGQPPAPPATPVPPKKVLNAINLDVAPGEMIALVGPSGAGKTTLCNLVARFYDPTDGAVRLDGIDLRDITVESYRRLLGIVEQDTFLFDGTIAENIAYGRRSVARGEIEEASKLANAHNYIIQLPDGYNTLIGERGVKLSGGQRQRLTIARAILADPKILILDEATSNLDTESERMIQTSLHSLMAGRTSFVIAHRLSTIAGADRIIVIDDGRIIEQGRHEELMRSDTRYRDMVVLQTSPPAPPKPHDPKSTPPPTPDAPADPWG